MNMHSEVKNTFNAASVDGEKLVASTNWIIYSATLSTALPLPKSPGDVSQGIIGDPIDPPKSSR
jgi:hypothetical protein